MGNMGVMNALDRKYRVRHTFLLVYASILVDIVLAWLSGHCTKCLPSAFFGTHLSFLDHLHREELDLSPTSAQVEERCNHKKYTFCRETRPEK